MRLQIETHGDLTQMVAAELATAERAVTAGVTRAGLGLKAEWRREIIGAGLGQRLARTIRNRTYPEQGASLEAAALVWSKAPEIVGAHARGALPSAADLGDHSGRGRRPAERGLHRLAWQGRRSRRLDLRAPLFARHSAGDRNGLLRALRRHSQRRFLA